ncbi:hypothetical protein [Aestuariivita boseongensis]|uniref:hypothetical protein n=1 Tax=Aestuariivita boseongensis TaxID=1470562 RepID=UPI0009E1DEB5|nr:hypothetical protein [Aestuariivita boseongensis]
MENSGPFSRWARQVKAWASPADDVLDPLLPTAARASLADAERLLHIPVRNTTEEDDECTRLRSVGQFLARQDRWCDLAAKIRMAERARSKTPGGMPVTDLLAFGARNDVVAAAEHAISEGVPAGSPALLSGIGGLEAVLSEHDTDPAIALVVALAHIDIGWAWRGSDAEIDVPKQHKSAFAAHFDRAGKILDRFNGVELDSPALAAARCALLPGLRDPRARIADDYEDLIDLDPHNERHMRAMGNHLLPRWFGDYAQLELEARRTASRSQDIWGHAGYTWVMFDAVANDEGACAVVDTDFFIDGLKDILLRRPGQATANLLAAYCAVSIARHGPHHATAPTLAACAEWVIRDHMTELHPLIWAHAAEGFDNAASVTSLSRFAAHGKARALAVLSDLFEAEIAEGQQITFTPEGVEITP